MRKILLTFGLLLSLAPFMMAQTEWTYITTENTSSGLPSDRIYALIFDKTGHLYIGTDMGIGSFFEGKWGRPTKGSPLDGKAVHNLNIDEAGNLWAISEEDGLGRLSPDGKWKLFNKSNGFNSDSFAGIEEDGKGGYWIANGQHATYMKEEKLKHESLTPNPALSLTSITVDKASGEVWAGYPMGLFRRKNGVWNQVPEADAFGGVQALLMRDGKLYVASEKGLQIYDGKSWKSIKKDDGIPDNFLTTVALDKEGAIWVGTDGSGVGKQLANGKWEVHNTQTGLVANDVYSIAFTANGRPWIGTHLGGISHLDDSGKWSAITATGLVGNVVNDILFAPKGVTWYATNSGVSRRDKSGKWTSFTPTSHSLPGLNAHSLLLDKAGNVWVAFFDNGVARYTPSEDRWTSFSKGAGTLPAQQVTGIAQTADEHIWITGYAGGGIAEYDGKSWKVYSEKDGIPSANLSSFFDITVAPDAAIWFASGMGALELRNGKFKLYDVASSKLADNNVRSIYVTPSNEVYFCTNRGLTVRTKDGIFTNYTASNGFISDFVNEILVQKDGSAWISCWTNGFYYMSKDKGFYKVQEKHGFTPAEAFKAFYDACGKLHVGSNKGIAILDNPKGLSEKLLPIKEVVAGKKNSVVVYPNPATDVVYFSETAQVCRLFNLEGTLISEAFGIHSLAVDQLTEGVYTLWLDGKTVKLYIARP